ncbi:MAG: hypothetical protein Q7J58_05540 [Hydrogenophaga sp.]|uniref:hypothetical protein n=1 Tax=Hydrogenophaga sp. TaxID=1904254 RepID=UPI00271C224F|nr:hypothetical protein [Hydrogenophaga sp.]MDO9568829.1 hypothetical protein [Hydrogenophaga sp.]
MQLEGVTYAGPPFEESDSELLAALPQNLRGLLEQLNGFILHSGGLHVRGVCDSPEWHSLRSVMFGPSALHLAYPALAASDVPFAQDCVADQFVLRAGSVYKLSSETGTLESLDLHLPAFFEKATSSPVEFLGMHPLLRHERESSLPLLPGQVLSVYPPFCTKEAANGVSLRPVPVAAALGFLSEFSASIHSVSEGEQIRVKVVP